MLLDAATNMTTALKAPTDARAKQSTSRWRCLYLLSTLSLVGSLVAILLSAALVVQLQHTQQRLDSLEAARAQETHRLDEIERMMENAAYYEKESFQLYRCAKCHGDPTTV